MTGLSAVSLLALSLHRAPYHCTDNAPGSVGLRNVFIQQFRHARVGNVACLIEPEACDRSCFSRAHRIHTPAFDFPIEWVVGAKDQDKFDPRPTVHENDPIGTRVLCNAQSTKQRPSVASLLGQPGERTELAAQYRRRSALFRFNLFPHRFLHVTLFRFCSFRSSLMRPHCQRRWRAQTEGLVRCMGDQSPSAPVRSRPAWVNRPS